MCCIPQNSARINVVHSQWINIGGYDWAGFALVFVTDWSEKNSGNTDCNCLTAIIINSIQYDIAVLQFARFVAVS